MRSLPWLAAGLTLAVLFHAWVTALTGRYVVTTGPRGAAVWIVDTWRGMARTCIPEQINPNEACFPWIDIHQYD